MRSSEAPRSGAKVVKKIQKKIEGRKAILQIAAPPACRQLHPRCLYSIEPDFAGLAEYNSPSLIPPPTKVGMVPARREKGPPES